MSRKSKQNATNIVSLVKMADTLPTISSSLSGINILARVATVSKLLWLPSEKESIQKRKNLLPMGVRPFFQIRGKSYFLSERSFSRTILVYSKVNKKSVKLGNKETNPLRISCPSKGKGNIVKDGI